MADVEVRDANTQAITEAGFSGDLLLPISLNPSGWGAMAVTVFKAIASGAVLISGTVAPSNGLKVVGRKQLYVNTTTSTLHFHSGVSADAWQSVGGGVSTPLAFQDEGNARASIETVDFVGAGVAATKSGTVLTVTVPGSTTPVQTHTNYVGIINGALSTVTTTAFSVSGITAALTIPSYSGTRRLLFARPSTEADPSEVFLYQSGMRNTINQIHTFMKSVRRR